MPEFETAVQDLQLPKKRKFLILKDKLAGSEGCWRTRGSDMKIGKLVIAVLALGSMSANAALIEVWQSGSGLTNLAQADALIAGGGPDYSENRSTINYQDGQNPGSSTHFGGDVPFPGGVTTNFAVRVTGKFEAPAGAIADFRMRHDDGARLTINGTTVSFAGLTNDRDTFINGLVLQAINTVEIVFFEHRGGAHLELGFRQSLPGATWGLLNLDDPMMAVPAPGALALLGLGLAGLMVRRRRV